MVVSRCFKGTRSELLQKIYDWVDDPNSKAIYWLCGLAGTGKSTIAQTVAEALNQRKMLGASFFFSRDVARRRDPLLVFTTIAYQLGRFHKSFCSGISASLRDDPDSCKALLQTQMEKLIAGPLRDVTDAPPVVVIVMDALDECSNEVFVKEILILLGVTIRELPFCTKVFITSRPNSHIRTRFNDDIMKDVSEASILHDIDLSVVQSDIRVYLAHQLREIGKEMLRLDAWPAQAEVEALADRAGGLFIYASASVAYIGDKGYHKPSKRLRLLLNDTVDGRDSPHGEDTVDGRDSPYGEVDKLYLHILRSAVPKSSPTVLQPIIGTIVTLFDPLSVRAMERLMSVEDFHVQEKLEPLNSILLVPDDPYDLIRIFHKSFPDFMTDPQRCKDDKFLIKRRVYFTRLALQCILIMNSSLRRNMCDIQYPFRLNDDIADLKDLLKSKVGSHVLYACQFWASHLQESDPVDQLQQALSVFIATKLTYWLEILSLSQHLDVALPSLKIAKAWYQGKEPKRLVVVQKMMPILEPLHVFNEALSSAEGKLSQTKTPAKILLSDCQYLLLHFARSIEKSACHIYHSALPLAPHCLLYKQYQRELQQSVRVVSKEYTWNPVLAVLRGNFRSVNDVCFSPDGLKLASVSGRDIYLWDSITRSNIRTLAGHTGEVNAVCFSPDGLIIASASDDKTVLLWDSTTGTHCNTFNGHTEAVWCVCFSPDGDIVASGSRDTTVRLWDLTGALIRTINGSGMTTSICFSPDGRRIATGCQDTFVYVWDSTTGLNLLKTLEGHTEGVQSVRFSPDGSIIASGSLDKL
ncbi:hypothetical protein FRC02_009950, partial [Tulasnella sp. 418]